MNNEYQKLIPAFGYGNFHLQNDKDDSWDIAARTRNFNSCITRAGDNFFPFWNCISLATKWIES